MVILEIESLQRHAKVPQRIDAHVKMVLQDTKGAMEKSEKIWATSV